MNLNSPPREFASSCSLPSRNIPLLTRMFAVNLLERTLNRRDGYEVQFTRSCTDRRSHPSQPTRAYHWWLADRVDLSPPAGLLCFQVRPRTEVLLAWLIAAVPEPMEVMLPIAS